jgi:ABC-2 type transport system permease protein
MILSIVRHELITQWRHKTIKIVLPLMVVLTVLVAMNHWQQQQDFIAIQHQWQQDNNEEWEAQPDRHPHRVGHYGSLVFRVISPLNFIDSGINPFVGNMLFLEAHRQNSSQFKQYISSHSYMQLGALSGSTLILVIWPLILIALGYSTVSSERQQGTLRQIMSLGVSYWTVLLGKALAYFVISVVFLLMIFSVALLFLSSTELTADIMVRFGSLFLLYLGYSVIWIGLVVVISATAMSNNRSLLLSLLVWLLMVVVIPKLAYGVAEWRYALPDRAVFDIEMAEAVAKVGDSHNPNDPYFSAFREKILAQYGVTQVEDLPVNWSGLVMQEGERITSEVFNQQYGQVLDVMKQQTHWVTAWAVLSPYLMSSQLSSVLSGTSTQHVTHYENEAESYRYQLIQSLNNLHINEVDNAHNKERISKSHWSTLDSFSYQTLPIEQEGWALFRPLLLLVSWLLGLTVVLFSLKPKVIHG